MKKLFFILAIIIISIFTPQKVFAIEYPDINLYYDYNRVIYCYNIKTNIKKALIQGRTPYLSHDKTRLLYSLYNKNPTLTNPNGIYLYSLNTKIEQFIYPQTEENITTTHRGWSLNDKYILLEVGGDVMLGRIMLDAVTWKELIAFSTLENQYTWINEDEIIYTDAQISQEVDYASRLGSPPFGISIINIKTQEKRVLKQATLTEDFAFRELKNNQIIFKKNIYNSKSHQQEQTSYWLMNMDGNILEEVKNYQQSPNPAYTLGQEVKHFLPESYNNASYLFAYLIDENWILITVNNHSQYNEFFVLDKANSNSLRKIGEGNSVTW